MITMLPSYSKRLTIIDVSGLLYTYTSVSLIARDQSAVMVKGVNIAGVKAVLEMCASCYKQQRRVLLCLDTFTDKKNTSSEYKANRTFVPQVAYQADIIEAYFKDFGVDVYRIKGYEADDLIYSAVLSNVNNFSDIEVVTGDKDIYGCIVAPHVRVTGVNSKSPSIDVYNYETCVDSKVDIPYNCILPYLTLFGKQSNNLKKLKIDGMNKEYFDEFVKMVNNYEASMGSDLSVMIDFLKSGVVREEHVEIIAERALLTYPQLIDLKLDVDGPNINADSICKFCNFFKQYTAANMYGVINYINSVEIDPSMPTMMKRIYASIKSGTKMADMGLMEGASMQVTGTTEFVGVDDW